MANIDSLQTSLVEQLRDLYDAEQRLTKAIPKMAKAATNEDLAEALQAHLAETEEHVARLEEAFGAMGETARAKACAGMRGIIEEGDDHVNEDFDDDGLRDATIIGAAQKVEHYEIAAYGTAAAHARLLRMDDIVRMLEQTLSEEKAADAKLTEIAEMVVNMDAATSDDEAAGNGASRGAASAGNGRASSRTTERGRPARPSRSSAHEKGRASARGRR
jgi:ferritin-like metal-binding protein YciE